MNIGFDLDKVFIDYPFFLPDFIIDRFYKKKANGKLSYRIPKKPEQLLRLLIHHPLLRQPIKTNIDFMKKLASQNTHKHYLISGRFGFLKNKTQKLVQKHELYKLFEGLYFNFGNQQTHLFKNDIIQRLKIDLYVDDDRELLKYLAKKNPKTKFFWLNKKVRSKIEKNLFAIKVLPDMFS
ncbi:MAG: hypothetical protein HYT07_00495 [Candidatus Levybacteria bacterium]|nr:hypothetical protein [Candidatus Levybacteria bacterium]